MDDITELQSSQLIKRNEETNPENNVQQERQRAEQERLQAIQKLIEYSNRFMSQGRISVDTDRLTQHHTIAGDTKERTFAHIESNPVDFEVSEQLKKEIVRSNDPIRKQKYEDRLAVTVVKDDEEVTAVEISLIFGKPQRLRLIDKGTYVPATYDDFYDRMETRFGRYTGREIGFDFRGGPLEAYHNDTALLRNIADDLAKLTTQPELLQEMFDRMQEQYGDESVTMD